MLCVLLLVVCVFVMSAVWCCLFVGVCVLRVVVCCVSFVCVVLFGGL